MPEQKNILQLFKEKKVAKGNSDVQEARRLVNLYRSLHCFGDDFVEQYNQMLLSASPRVQRLLGTFMGGDEVAEYAEFLKQTSRLNDSEKQSEENVSNAIQGGYLPTPTQDLSKQPEASQEIEQLKMQQKALLDQVQQLMQNIKSKSPMVKSSTGAEEYSEIIEE